MLADKFRAFIFDLDGTIYLGDKALTGAVETVRYLRKHDKKILFVTNKPLEPREVYARKLHALGIPAQADDIITSGYVLGYHLARNLPGLRLYVIGEPALHAELKSHGLTVVDGWHQHDHREVMPVDGIDAVVAAFDRTFDYRKLNIAYQALKNGAQFFATNADKACPMPGGAIPDAGAIIAALEHLTNRSLDLLAGKPSRLITDVVLQRLDLLPEQCLMIGDRLETDMLMGQRAGMNTALVLTGASSREDVQQQQITPDFILNHIGELMDTS